MGPKFSLDSGSVSSVESCSEVSQKLTPCDSGGLKTLRGAKAAASGFHPHRCKSNQTFILGLLCPLQDHLLKAGNDTSSNVPGAASPCPIPGEGACCHLLYLAFHSSQNHSVRCAIEATQNYPDLKPVSRLLPNPQGQVPQPLGSSGRDHSSLCPKPLG